MSSPVAVGASDTVFVPAGYVLTFPPGSVGILTHGPGPQQGQSRALNLFGDRFGVGSYDRVVYVEATGPSPLTYTVALPSTQSLSAQQAANLSSFGTTQSLRNSFFRTDPALATNLLSTFNTNSIAAGGAALLTATSKAISAAISRLMATSAWPKILELWVPIADTSDAAGRAGAATKLKYLAGAAAALASTGFVDGDYTPAGGFLGASGKTLTSDFNPTTVVAAGKMAVGEQGFCGYAFGANTRGTMGTTTINGQTVSTGYPGGTGVIVGAASGSLFFTPLAGSNLVRIGGVSITPQTAGGRMRAVQVSGGQIQDWFGGSLENVASSSGFNNANVAVTIGSSGGASSNNFTGNLGGYAYFQSLTSMEMGYLIDFFDAISIAMGRPIWFEELLGLGDSNTFAVAQGNGTPPSATQRWTYLMAQDFVMTENNQGYPGGTISSGGTQNSMTTTMPRRWMAAGSRLSAVMYGTNDVAQAIGISAINQLQNNLQRALNARISQQILVIGVGDVNWPVAAASYPGSGYAINFHDTTQIPAFNAQVRAIVASLALTNQTPCNIGYADLYLLPNILQPTDGVHNIVASHAQQASAFGQAFRGMML